VNGLESTARAWTSGPGDAPLAAADVLAKARAENFPVALRLLPRAARRDLLALYGFARLVDDLGDEAPGDRLAALDALEADLDRAYRGAARHPLLRRLEPVLRAHELPREPFARLIEANRRDQRVGRYPSWEALREYCALSADPVGRLVLRVFDAATQERDLLSDSICSALQLIEHCQDVAEDCARGRVYLPAEDLDRFGCREPDLGVSPAPAALRGVIGFEVARARELLARGEPLLGELHAFARLAVAGFAAGGYAACDALERAGFDPNARSSRRRDVARWMVRLLRRARRARRPTRESADAQRGGVRGAERRSSARSGK
jgi:squalene synthase HpnC